MASRLNPMFKNGMNFFALLHRTHVNVKPKRILISLLKKYTVFTEHDTNYDSVTKYLKNRAN